MDDPRWGGLLLDEIVRDGARQMLAAALQAEVAAYIDEHGERELIDAVRRRQRVTKGPDFRGAGIAMAFKLIQSAHTKWRAVNAPHIVALVRAGAVFVNGELLERPDDDCEREAA